MTTTVFVTVVVARFLLPLLIPRFPLPAILACLVLDAADQTIFQAVSDSPLAGYQTYDKALDVHYLAIAYISTMRNWRPPVAFEVARFLFLYRLVGVTLFELLGHRWLLLVFPNTFEYFFIAYEAVRTRWDPQRLSARDVVGMAAGIWIVVKLPQEWWIHVAKLDFTDVMGDRPYLWLVLAAAAAALGVAAWSRRSSLPPTDWPFTVDVDVNLPVLDEQPSGREPFWSGVLAEKVVLLALISVIFARILPDLESSDLGLAIGVSAFVVLNAAISNALRRHGRTWQSAGRTFVAMLLVNTALVVIDSVVGTRRADLLPAGATEFFVVLLSLLTALYDRYRHTRDPSELRRVSVWRRVSTNGPS